MQEPQQINSLLKKSPAERGAVYKVIPSYINCRTSPSTSAGLVGRRFAGDCFETDLERNGWVRCVEKINGKYESWTLVDGKSLNLGVLLERVPSAAAANVELAPPRNPEELPSSDEKSKAIVDMLVRPPKPVPSSGPMPAGVTGPVHRWRVQRPMTMGHAQPSRSSAIVDVVLEKQLVWSGVAETVQAATDLRLLQHGGGSNGSGGGSNGSGGGSNGSGGGSNGSGGGSSGSDAPPLYGSGTELWHRLADPDGWVHFKCPGGFTQLRSEASRHAGNPEREMEALDLYMQARVACHQTYGPKTRFKLAELFEGWEAEVSRVGLDPGRMLTASAADCCCC